MAEKAAMTAKPSRISSETCGVQARGDAALVGRHRLFPFCSTIFSSWDFHLSSSRAARQLQMAIKHQLQELVNDATLKDAGMPNHKRPAARLRCVSHNDFLYAGCL